MADCRILQSSSLFSGFTQAQLLDMLNGMRHEDWPRGYSLNSAEQLNEHFYLLIKGRVKVGRHHLENGRELTLFLLGPGDAFNVLSLVDGGAHGLHVTTLDAVDVLSAPMGQWLHWLDQYPSLRSAMAAQASRQIEHITNLACELALDDTMTRLVNLLLRYFDVSSGASNLIRDLPQEELANMIGTVRPVVARLLARLREEGIVDMSGRELSVHDLSSLLAKAHDKLQKLNGG